MKKRLIASGKLMGIVAESNVTNWLKDRKDRLVESMKGSCESSGVLTSDFSHVLSADDEDCGKGEVRVELEFQFWCE